jgi:hypothetical protein
MVFSWYMLFFSDYYVEYNAPEGDVTTINGYKRDIQDAVNTGIDGFALFYYNDGPLVNNAYNFFEAARQYNAANPSASTFWLFMSPQLNADTDVQGNIGTTGQNWVFYTVNRFASHPNYYHINGKALLSDFCASGSGIVPPQQQTDLVNLVFNPLAANGIGVFFVPTGFDPSPIMSGGVFNSWGNTYLGSINYWTGSAPAVDINGVNDFATKCIASGKAVVPSIGGANYWGADAHGNNAYFEHFGGEGPRDEWINIIGMNPPATFVMETTWNDYTESYTTPISVAAQGPSGANTIHAQGYTVGAGGPLVEAIIKEHRGYAELRRYYAQWYTTGIKPTIAKDLLIYFYRTSAYNLSTGQNPATNGGPDNVFVTAELTASATLQINTGGVITTYSLLAGVSYTNTPFTVGSQNFQIQRGGITIINVSGDPVVGSIPGPNLEYTSGFAYAA